VRVNLLQPDATGGLHALDLRIGHEEAKAQVPAGGIICHIPVNKTAFPDPVIAGSGASSSTPASCAAYPGCFTWTISIPTDAHSLDGLACDLVHIKVDDVASVKEAPDPHHPPKFTIISASNGGVVQGDSVSWADVGSYHPGNPPIQLVISGSVPADSGPGLLEDIVNVSAGLGNCTGGTQGSELLGNARLVGTALTNSNAATGNSLVRGQFTLEGPHVQAGAELPRTGDNPNRAPLGLALAGAGAIAFIVRRRLTHRPADNA
jgi:LPXTG-motif cell wall-anchored protein